MSTVDLHPTSIGLRGLRRLTLVLSGCGMLSALAGCDQPVSQAVDSGHGTSPISYSLVNGQGDFAMCGGTGQTNSASNGIDRTCLLHGDIGLNLNLTGVGSWEILDAMDSWNRYLGELTSMPVLQEVQSGGVPFNVHGASTTSLYCGDTPSGTGGHVLRVDIWPSDDVNCSGKGKGALQEIAVHEMGHVLGWNRGHGNSPASANSYTAGCAVFINIGTVPLSSFACHHDVEALFRAKASPTGWVFNSAYVNSPILWDTDAPAFATVAAGQSTQVNITHWLGTTGSSVAKGNSSVNWVSGNQSYFTVSSTGLVTGQSTGSAKLYLKAGDSVPGYTVWTRFSVNGDSLTVQVTQPPYVVTSDQTPITTAGYHTFTSHVGDPGASRIWAVDDSRTISVDPDTTFQTPDNTAILWVEAGSYTLRFHVYGDYQDIPVCTDGGNLFAPGNLSPKGSLDKVKAPGPTPNVVEGCLPGQGGGDQ